MTIQRDGIVGLQWLINSKPFLGRPIQMVDTIPTEEPALSRKFRWNGTTRLLNITLNPEFGKVKPPPIRRKGPIGKRYKIDGRLVVTNAEDGVLDNTVEIMGVLAYYQRGGKTPMAKPKRSRCAPSSSRT